MYQFHDVRFPEDIAYGSMGGPEFSTIIHTQKNGQEFRNINWQHARLKFNISCGIRTRTQMDEMIGFFRARMGRAFGFRFKDWSDYIADNIIAIGDGVTQEFQLIKSYESGNGKYVRIITKPVANSVIVTIDQKLCNFEINDSGMIKLESVPSENSLIVAKFEFDVPVRFENDIFMAGLSHSDSFTIQNINLIEVKE